MNSVGSGFYVGFVCDRGCKGTDQKIIRVASSKETVTWPNLERTVRELVVKLKGL